MIRRLDAAEREAALADLPEWTFEAKREAIIRSLRFADFAEAFAFMTRIAILAEKADHHPEWSNIYNKVEILLTTHDCGGLSERDLSLARAIDAALAA